MPKFMPYLLALALPANPAAFAHQEGAVEIVVIAVLEVEKAPVPKATPSPEPRTPPRAHLTCYPNPKSFSRIGMAGAHGFSFRARVFVSDPDEQFWCPEVEWEINRTQSSHEVDCDPYDQIVAEEGEPPATWSSNFLHAKLGPGVWVVKVRLKKAGKSFWDDDCQVDVR